jgi:molybdenum cofactor cytidylyltransferase
MSRPGLIVLAAGGSSRMGRPKQLLPWNGRTLLHLACETALATPCRPVIVVLGCAAEACAREVAGLGVIPVVNPEWTRGMGGSVATGIAALEAQVPDATGAVLMLVDQPTVTAAHLEGLMACGSAPSWPITATKYPEGGGVPAFFDRSFFPELRALDSDRGARAIIVRESHRVRLVDPGQRLADLDTPEAYRDLSSPPTAREQRE